MKIKVGEKYVVDVLNCMNDEPISLVLSEKSDSQWSYRGLAFLGKKFPNVTFVVE